MLNHKVIMACSWAFLAGVVITTGLALSTLCNLNSSWQKWALDNGHAHYDSKTGAFVLENRR